MSAIRVNGQWKTPSIVYARVEGQWKIVGQAYSKVDGLWRQTTFASPPTKPIMSYVSTGVFQISNYNSTLIYEAVFRVGSGSASFNSSNGRYTLNGENSGFDVVARYATGAPASLAGYMERKKYSFGFRDVIGQCCSSGGPCSTVCNGSCSTNPDSGGYGQCGCVAPAIWFNGTVDVSCPPQICNPCVVGRVQDVLINEPGYINSGTEWYKVA
jgi:hypothetical protein